MFALAACENQESVSAPACPTIVIVKDTADLTTFRPGPGRDLTDVVIDARLARFDGSCETDLERDQSGRVNVDLQLLFEIERGPANQAPNGQFRYYVAIAERDGGAILAKKVFATEFEFEDSRRRIGGVEELIQEIPLQPGKLGEDFEIYVGFQLTPEQLQYNRAKRGQ